MLIQATQNTVFNQLQYLLEKLPAELYSQSVGPMGHATIGQHVRHTLEFYTCLLEGVASGTVCYDHRRRNPVLETSPAAALECLAYIEQEIARVECNLPLVLEAPLGRQGTIVHQTRTHFDRELLYLSEHSTHHLALVRFALAFLAPDFTLPTDMGIAESTLRYRATHNLTAYPLPPQSANL